MVTAVRNIRDTFINKAAPDKNKSGTSRIYLDGVGSNERKGLLYFGKPFVAGGKMTDCKLRLWNAAAISGTVTLSVQRITSKFAMSRVTWNNQPTVGGAAVTATRTNAPANGMWEFDITPILQAVANGAEWYGLVVKVDADGPFRFYSANAELEQYRPQVEINWTDAPEPPEGLSPDGGRIVPIAKPMLNYIWADEDGDNYLTWHQFELATDPNFTASVWNSGWLATSTPSLDLALTSFPGMTSNTTYYWRVKIRDSTGQESPWPDAPASMKYVAKGVITINSLTSGPNGTWYVTDSSPRIFWSYSGTQMSYRVQIEDASDPKDVYFNSKKVTGSTQSIETGDGLLVDLSKTYRLRIWVWDDVLREQNGTDPIYSYAERVFTYQRVAGSAGVTNLQLTLQPPYPWADLTFTSSTVPDSFMVERDGIVVEDDIDPAELFVSGSNYAYRDKTAPPRIQHTWKVIAKRNGVDSITNPSVVGTTKPYTTWLMQTDSSDPICIVKAADRPTSPIEVSLNSFQEVHKPVGDAPPVLITQYVSGYEGRVEGTLADDIVEGLTAAQMRDRFKKFKRNPGKPMLLYMVDEVLKIVPYNLTYRPRAKGGGKVLYDISFDFFEDYK